MHVSEHQVLPKEKEAEAQTFQMLGLDGSRKKKPRSWRVPDLVEPIQSWATKKKRGPLLSIQSWLINRVLTLVYYSPCITGQYNALCNLNNKVFFIVQMEKNEKTAALGSIQDVAHSRVTSSPACKQSLEGLFQDCFWYLMKFFIRCPHRYIQIEVDKVRILWPKHFLIRYFDRCLMVYMILT